LRLVIIRALFLFTYIKRKYFISIGLSAHGSPFVALPPSSQVNLAAIPGQLGKPPASAAEPQNLVANKWILYGKYSTVKSILPAFGRNAWDKSYVIF